MPPFGLRSNLRQPFTKWLADSRSSADGKSQLHPLRFGPCPYDTYSNGRSGRTTGMPLVSKES